MLRTYIDSLRYKYRTKDGTAFEGGSNWDDKVPLELGIGSGSFIPGFEDGLIGVIPSNTSKENPFELHVTFPEGYKSADLAGKAVVLNMEGINTETAQRIIDFTSGATYSMNGNLQKISSYIFIATPQTVELSGDFQDLFSGGGLDISGLNIHI